MRRGGWLILVTGVALSGATLVCAQPPEAIARPEPLPSTAPLTLPELESLALQHSPAIAKAHSAIEAAQGKHLQAGLYPNPTAGYIADDIGLEGKAGKQGAFIGQEIVTAGKLKLDRAVASHEVARARWEYDTQRRRLLNDLRGAFYEVLLAQRSETLHEDLVRIAEEGLRAAEQLLKAKEVSRVDLLESRIAANTARMRLQNARNQSWASWRRLAIVAGTPQLTAGRLSGDLDTSIPDLVWEETLARLLAQSPEIAKARSDVDKARCTLARECAQRHPNLEVIGYVQYDNAAAQTVTAVQLGMPLPIYNRNQGNIAAAQSELAAAQAELRRVELELHDHLVTQYLSYIDTRRQVDTYRTNILPDARASLELVGTGYRQGEISYLNLLTAQRTHTTVSLAYLETLRTLWQSAITIEGLLLRGSVHESAPGVALDSVQFTE